MTCSFEVLLGDCKLNIELTELVLLMILEMGELGDWRLD